MEHVYLVGADDVVRAGSRIASAASDMQRAANIIGEALYQHRQYMEEWILHLEEVFKHGPNIIFKKV